MDKFDFKWALMNPSKERYCLLTSQAGKFLTKFFNWTENDVHEFIEDQTISEEKFPYIFRFRDDMLWNHSKEQLKQHKRFTLKDAKMLMNEFKMYKNFKLKQELDKEFYE